MRRAIRAEANLPGGFDDSKVGVMLMDIGKPEMAQASLLGAHGAGDRSERPGKHVALLYHVLERYAGGGGLVSEVRDVRMVGLFKRGDFPRSTTNRQCAELAPL